MQISITGRHVEVPQSVREYAEKKASKLLKFYDRIQAIEVIFEEEGVGLRVEMIVSADKRTSFVGHEVGEDANATIDLLVDKLERQITRHKKKLRNRKHNSKRTEPYTES